MKGKVMDTWIWGTKIACFVFMQINIDKRLCLAITYYNTSYDARQQQF